MISNSHYVVDVLKNEVHKENCDCLKELHIDNVKSLGFQKNALEAVLQAKNLGYEKAVCKCAQCQDEK